MCRYNYGTLGQDLRLPPCRLLAHSGHFTCTDECPLLGVKADMTRTLDNVSQ